MRKKTYLSVGLTVVVLINSMPARLWAAPSEDPVTEADVEPEQAAEQVEQVYVGLDMEEAAESRFGTCTLIVGFKEPEEPDFDPCGAQEKVALGNGTCLLSYPDEEAAEEAWKQFCGMENILFAEPDGILESADIVPESGKTETTAGEAVEGDPGAWQPELTPGEAKEPVRIAVIDTGVDGSEISVMPYLSGEAETGTDENGHGTRVAGLMARALSSQGIGGSLIQILPVKAADADGRCTVSQLYLGIRSAIGQGADIINISMGTRQKSGFTLLSMAAEEAGEAGILIVASAGNEGSGVMDSAPANIESVVTVGAVTEGKQHAEFSNYGAAIDCVAYGEDLLWKDGEALSGTSYAAALVSAAFAGAFATGALKDAEGAEAYLQEQAEDLGTPGWDELYGYGLLAATVPEFVPEAEEEETEEPETEPADRKDDPVARRSLTMDTYNEIVNALLCLAGAEGRQAAEDLAEGVRQNIGILYTEGVEDPTLFFDGTKIGYRASGREAVDGAAGELESLLAAKVTGQAPESTKEEAVERLEVFLAALSGYLKDDPMEKTVTVQATEVTVTNTEELAALADDGKDYIVKLAKNFSLTAQIVIKNGTKLHLVSSNTGRRTLTLSEANFSRQQMSAFVVESDGKENALYLGASASGSYKGNSRVTIDGGQIRHGGFLVYNGKFAAGNTAASYKAKFYMFPGTVLQNNNTHDKGGWTSGPTGSAVCNYGYLTMSGGTIRNNTFSKSGNGVIGNGGGIANYHRMTVTGGTIEGNSADQGGGIFVEHTRLTVNGQPMFSDAACSISGAVIRNNSSIGNGSADPNGHGGGICITGGSAVTVEDCSIYGNNAYYGGGIYNTGSGRLTVKDSSLYGNAGTYTGGAILNEGGTLALNTVRIYQNGCSGVPSHPQWAGGVASIKKGTVTAAISIRTGLAYKSWFYDNDGYSIHINCGTLDIGNSSRFGVSEYTGITDYKRVHTRLGSGVSCTGGTVSVTGAARMLVPEGATGFYTGENGTLNIGNGAGIYLLCKDAAYGICNKGSFTSGTSVGDTYPYIIDGTGDYGIANTGNGKAFLRGLVRGNYTIGETARTEKTGTALNTPGFDRGIYNTSAASYSSAYPYAVVLTGTQEGNTKHPGLVQYAAVGISNNAETGKVCVGSAKVLNCRKTSDGKKGYGIYNKGTLAVSSADALVTGNAMCGIYNTGTTAMTGGSVSANAEHGVYNTGNFTMDGAGTAITGNGGAASGSGAGIYNKGNVTLKNGSISGNRAGTYGGGVMNKAGAVFIMTGGKINGNLCEQNTADTTKGLGGAIYNEEAGTVSLYAGYIYGNNEYAVRNKGILNVATQTTPASGSQYLCMGVSSYTSSTAYTVSVNTLGNICSYGNGTISIGRSGTVNAGAFLVTNGGTNIYTNGTLTVAGNTKAPAQVVLTGKGTGIENAGGAVTLDTGLVITAQTTGISNTGTLTMKGGTISACTGNGITNGTKGNAVFSGGTVSTNGTGIANAGTASLTAGTVISGNRTHGVYQNGTFYMSGAAKVDISNDVCLPVGHVITVNGKLTTNGVVAELTPLDNAYVPIPRIEVEKKNQDKGGLGRKVVTTAYTGGVGSQALFYGTEKNRFTLTNEGILRPGDYMSPAVLAQENHSEINGVDIVISETYDVTYEKNIKETDENGNPVDVEVSDFPSTQSKYWCENLKLPNGTDQYTDPSVQTEPYKGFYIFTGWNGAADGSGKEYHMPETYRENAAATIYAQWMKKIKVAYIGNGQSAGEDFIDDGSDGNGIALSGDYTFDSNIDTATAEDHFTKDIENSYTDVETGEKVVQETTAKVVGWTNYPDKEKTYTYELGETAATSSVYERALQQPGAVTMGAPNSDFGAYPKEETAEQATLEQSFPVLFAQADGITENTLFASAEGNSSFQLFDAPADTTPYINMYAVWDNGPLVEAYDLYYSLEEAQGDENGTRITMQELLSHAKVTDEEDLKVESAAELPEKQQRADATTYYTIMDYLPEDFTGFTASGSVTETYLAVDSAGNITRKRITVHIVDTSGTEIKSHRNEVRFISKKYLNTLDEDSIWNTNPEYHAELTAVLDNERINMERTKDIPIFGNRFERDIPGSGEWKVAPQETWRFTHEEVEKVQDYIDANGFGKTEHTDALRRFRTEFAGCKQ